MIDTKLLETLAAITPEEERIIKDKQGIDRSLYDAKKGEFTVCANKLLESGRLITVRPHTRFINFPEHRHDYVEVVYMCSGSTTHIINGKQITLNEGELLFLGQSATQEIKAAGKNDIAVNFIVLPQFFQYALDMIGEEDTPIRKFVVDCLSGTARNAGYLLFRVADVLPVQNVVENLIWTLKNNLPNKRHINQMTMGLLFVLLLNHTDRLAYDSNEEEAVFKAIRYIETNYKSSNLSDIASELHYDYFWLSREIKRKTGRTYKELLQEKRLAQASFFLKNTTMCFSDISEAVGYENVSYFRRLFANRFGVTPKEYRVKANKCF